MFWDYLSQNPESVHQVMILFSDRGTPDAYHRMHGYSGHTFKWVNEKGEFREDNFTKAMGMLTEKMGDDPADSKAGKGKKGKIKKGGSDKKGA